ncbi:unnamed protein product [Prunus brigantina]
MVGDDLMNECGIKNYMGFYYTFSGNGAHERLLGLNSDSEILAMLSFIPGNRHIVVYGDHDVDMSDVIEETDDCNEEAVEGDGEAAEGNGKASLHNVPIYEDDDDEPNKEIYDEENDATLEDNHWFQNNVDIP